MSSWLIQHHRALMLALRRLAATPLATTLSLLAIGIALALPAGSQMLLVNVTRLTGGGAQAPQISLFLELGADKRAIGELANRLKNDRNVKSVRFIAREDTLARMKASEELADVIDALPKNPFPDAFVLIPADDGAEAMEQLAAELRKLPKVEHVQLDSAWARRLDALLNLARTGVVMLAVLLGIGLLTIVFNTIRLQVLTGRDEIEVSRLLGATNGYIRRPFQYFGAIQGLLGGAVAWLIVAGIAIWLRSPVAALARTYGLDFILMPLSGPDSTVLLGASAALGWLGATVSVGQHLKRC